MISLGYSVTQHTIENQDNGQQHVRLKSKNSERVCLLPDFVIEELTLAFERYQQQVLQNPDFQTVAIYGSRRMVLHIRGPHI